MKNKQKRFLVLTGLVLSAVVLSIVLRLFSSIPNFAPIAAIALFSGAYFVKKQWAFVVTFCALFFSDLFIQIQYSLGYSEFPGFYGSMIFVYGSIAAIVAIGFLLKNRVNVLTIAGGIIGGVLLFFLVTNFGVWLTGSMYAKSFSGLIECYIAGIPFIRGTLLGDAIYGTLLFGAFELILATKHSWKLNRVEAQYASNEILDTEF